MKKLIPGICLIVGSLIMVYLGKFQFLWILVSAGGGALIGQALMMKDIRKTLLAKCDDLEEEYTTTGVSSPLKTFDTRVLKERQRLQLEDIEPYGKVFIVTLDEAVMYCRRYNKDLANQLAEINSPVEIELVKKCFNKCRFKRFGFRLELNNDN